MKLRSQRLKVMRTKTHKVDVVFVLRGRPGLGHVMPGLGVAVAAVAKGLRVAVLTYGNGYDFLKRSGLSSLIEIFRLDCTGPYKDWPGLDLYDHGLREILPLVGKLRPRICCLGGEYMMAPLASVLPCKTAMFFNPDIFEKQDKNIIPSTLFLHLFSVLDYLVPMAPVDEARTYMAGFRYFHDKLTTPGPFLYRPATLHPRKVDEETVNIVIANGGGIAFPGSTASYSSMETDPNRWLDQTRIMTRTAIEAVLANAWKPFKVDVFSCLDDDENTLLAREYACNPCVTVQPVSLSFYTALEGAHLVVSRAGAGFIADVADMKAAVAIWPLQGHDEQYINASAFAGRRKNTKVCVDTESMRTVITELLDAVTIAPIRHMDGTGGSAGFHAAERLLAELIN